MSGLLDVNKGTSKLWFDLDENDRYNDPGISSFYAIGKWQVCIQSGKTDPFISVDGEAQRMEIDPLLIDVILKQEKSKEYFDVPKGKYEYFVDFAEEPNSFIMSSESSTTVPNFYLAQIGRIH